MYTLKDGNITGMFIMQSSSLHETRNPNPRRVEQINRVVAVELRQTTSSLNAYLVTVILEREFVFGSGSI
eukprot:m.157358 g.157358  ORF g.157358 m.157358 type:complete len:70 (-) comp11727_c0_seq18:1370-1579(-)